MTRLHTFRLGLALGLLLAGDETLAATLPRENIAVFSQSPAKLKKLRDAVAALDARGLNDATSWFNVAGVHGILRNDPNLPAIPDAVKSLFNQCHSDPSLFFAWHRAYVAALERLLQAAISDPDFRLPYWDWYTDPTLPAAFRDEFLDPRRTQRNPLYRPQRKQEVNRGRPVWTPRVVTNYNDPSFRWFQSGLSDAEHSSIHSGVGGPNNMASVPFAARDPIFFLHHANIDRLLTVWRKIDLATHQAPSQLPAWDSARYRFPIDGGGVATPTVRELALGEFEMLGYRYDDMNPPSPLPPSLPERPDIVETRSGDEARITQDRFAIEEGGGRPIEVGAGATIELRMPTAGRDQILQSLEPSPSPLKWPALVLSGVRAPSVPPEVLSYRVFVELPDARTPAGFHDHYVGSISFFDVQHEQEMHGAASMIELRLTENNGGKSLRTLDAAGGAEVKLRVSLVPELAPDAKAPSKPVIFLDSISLEMRPVQ